FGEFFLDLDDRFGLTEPGCQPLVIALQPFVLGDQGGIGRDLPPATLGFQPGERPFVALFPPSGQVRRVQALAAQHGAELAGLGRSIGLTQSAKLVLSGEASPHGLLRHGRVRDRLSVAGGRPTPPRGGGGGRRNSSRATPSFRSAGHRLICFQHPCLIHLSTTSMPSTVMTREAVVSSIIGTEGGVDATFLSPQCSPPGLRRAIETDVGAARYLQVTIPRNWQTFLL